MLGAVLHLNCIKNHVRNEKVDFMKMSVSCRRELDFQGPGASKSLQKTPQNQFKKQCIFKVENASKIKAKITQKGTANEIKKPSKNNAKKGSEKETKKTLKSEPVRT